WALFRYTGGRLGVSVDSFLLDLRTSGGVCAGASGIRVCERDYSRLLTEGDFWVWSDGCGDGGDRVHQPYGVGAPYVYGGDDVGRQYFLYAFDDAGLDPDRHQDFQLAGYDV